METNALLFRCCEERTILCVDGEWGRCGICCVMVGVTSSSACLLIRGTGDLPCPLAMEEGTVVPMLQRDAQHTGCADASMSRTT